MRIRKKYQVIPTNAKLENGYSTSDKNGYTCEYMNSLNEYSTEEVRIGTYNNKPLYRIIITSSITASGNTEMTDIKDISSLNIDEIVKKDGQAIITTTNGKQYQPVFYASASEFYRYWINLLSTSKVITSKIQIGSTLPVTFQYILEYTKTTD